MIDLTKHYIVPMAKSDDPYGKWDQVEITLDNSKDPTMIVGIPLIEGYDRHYYREPYFEWLLYIGTIKEKSPQESAII